MKLNKLLFILIFSTMLMANEKVTLQLSWLHQFQFAGYYVAKEKGFYKDVNLDVEIKEYNYGMAPADEIRDKSADFAIGKSSLLINKANGEDIVALGAIYQQSPLMLLVTKDSGIENINDLRNKRVMITSDAKSSAAIIAMLNSNNLTLKDIQIQKHSFDVNDLINNKTDAMASYVSNEPIILENKNTDYRIFHPKSYGFDFYGDILFTSREFIKKNPKLAEDFFNASIKGWDYAFENIDETVEIIYEKYNTQNKTKSDLKKEGHELKKLVYDHNDEMIGCLDKSKLQKIVDVYKVLGLMNSDINFDEFIYENNHHQTYAFELSKLEVLYLIVSAVFVVLLLILFFIYSSIKAKWIVTRSQLIEEVGNAKKEIEIQKDKVLYHKNILNDIIDNSKNIIILKDENLNYLQCNEYFASLFGKTKDEIIGKNDFFLFDEDIAKFFREQGSELIKSGRIMENTEWLQFPNKQKKQLFNTYSKSFEYEKGKKGLLVYSSDITELKMLEDESLQNQRLLQQQSKILSIEKLLRNIAHQWRQPLTAISVGMSNIKATYEIDGKLDEKEVLLEVDNSIQKTEYLSKVIETFSNYFSSNNKKYEEMDITEIFDSLDTVIFNSLSENSIEIIKDINPIKLYTNKNLLVQSLINIYKNSIEAFNTQEVPNENRYLFISAQENDNSLILKIKDSAYGISEETREQIFEPYFTTKHKELGVGLSLYITHHIIVDIFNGSISANKVLYEYENKEMKGTEFTITLPLR